MGIKAFDQWLEHDESMDYDPVADAEKVIREVGLAKQNWDSKLSEPWEEQVDRLIGTVKTLLEFIAENI